MATVYTKTGKATYKDNDLRIQAYNSLRIAAERIGFNNWKSGQGITTGHIEVIKAMPMVLDGRISPDSAMNLLQRGDILQQRLG